MQITYKVFDRCKRGDRKAQKTFFDAFKRRIMGVCKRYTANREEAEDVFQESFIKIFNGIKQVHDFQYLERWIIKTAVNTAINYYHKNKRHHDYFGLEGITTFDERDGAIIDELNSDTIINMVNDLPTGYRLVFNLYVIEGYKHNEIGEILDISENTSKSQLSRAKSLLKRKLKELGIEKFEKYG
ncbi:MAG: RNA polymerase sigma factor [Bacteroidota bacterium]